MLDQGTGGPGYQFQVIEFRRSGSGDRATTACKHAVGITEQYGCHAV